LSALPGRKVQFEEGAGAGGKGAGVGVGLGRGAERAALATLAAAICSRLREAADFVCLAALRGTPILERFEGVDESILLRKQVREMQR
jgi:hypothetical protein